MELKKDARILVVGAGTMGPGIANFLLQADTKRFLQTLK